MKKIRDWLIRKLGGYTMPVGPAPAVHAYDLGSLIPVQAEAELPYDADSSVRDYTRKAIAKKLGEALLENNMITFEDDYKTDYDLGIKTFCMRGAVRVVARKT